jgi:hypothetical protein
MICPALATKPRNVDTGGVQKYAKIDATPVSVLAIKVARNQKRSVFNVMPRK